MTEIEWEQAVLVVWEEISRDQKDYGMGYEVFLYVLRFLNIPEDQDKLFDALLCARMEWDI